MAMTLLLALVLVESALETFWRGSPIRWSILAIAGCWVVAMIPAAMFLRWGGRLWLTTVALVGLVVFAAWRPVSTGSQGLVLATLQFPRLVPLVIVVALLLFAGLLLRFRAVQRLPLAIAAVALLTLYCLVPFAFAVVYGTPVASTVRGMGLWTKPPLLAQGGYLALQAALPLGVLLAAAAWLGAIAGRARRGSAVFPAVCVVVFAGAFLVGSVELARASLPNLMSRFAPDWLPAGIPGTPAAAPAAAAPAPPSVPPVAGATSTSSGVANSAATPSQGGVAADQGTPGKTIDLSVEGVQYVSAIGDHQAPAGQTFVVVRTTWKTPAGSAPIDLSLVARHLWLLADNRYAEPLDAAATAAVADHLPSDSQTLTKAGTALTGQVVFRAAANASYLALVLLDRAAGSTLVAVKGRPIDAPPVTAVGPSASNDELTLTITDARWAENAPAAPAGQRFFTLGLRAVGRAPGDVSTIDFAACAHLQADQGQMLDPQPAAWLSRPFARPAAVLPGIPNEGQLAFLLPADTKSAKFVLRPPAGGVIDLPLPHAFGPARPDR